MRYAEEDYLQLSGIQHFAFCRRQWGLIHVEGQWEENVRTVEGDFLHQKTHDVAQDECRNGILMIRGMPVHSPELGVSGACDVVEFHPDPEGISLSGREGRYCAYPVEYKRGEPKENDCDRLQLCAQALCLEQMLACAIKEGALYYGETRRREKVFFDEGLRQSVSAMVAEMHTLMRSHHTPKPKRAKRCNACSLKELCLPSLEKTPSVADYLRKRMEENEA